MSDEQEHRPAPGDEDAEATDNDESAPLSDPQWSEGYQRAAFGTVPRLADLTGRRLA